MKSFPIVILGGGVVAGYAAKEFAAQSGKKGGLTIVTAENALPYERPPLSKGFLASKEEASGIQISDAAFYRDHGIAVLRNFPVGKVDFRARCLHGPAGKRIGYDQLLIATGSTVRRLPVPGADRPEVFYLRQMKDSLAIHAQIKRGKRAVMIGSGFIGMEVASVLAGRGVQTTMVFPDDRVWKRLFTQPISAFFERQFSGRGITFIKTDKVVAITHENHGCQVVLESGNQIPTDFVVAGIGVIPTVELFHRTALETSDGIKVNEFLETTVPGVWAAGDIANYPDQILHRPMRVEHWDNRGGQIISGRCPLGAIHSHCGPRPRTKCGPRRTQPAKTRQHAYSVHPCAAAPFARLPRAEPSNGRFPVGDESSNAAGSFTRWANPRWHFSRFGRASGPPVPIHAALYLSNGGRAARRTSPG
jgi:NADPH-dependent 2,4-dienoyl-CoA reductase/sulfur reductase-like enzyme